MSIATVRRVARFAALALALVGASNAATYSEDAVKAAFLHRFGAYVRWPAQPAPDAPFVIAVAGADDVAEQLGQLLPGLRIQNHRAEVRRVESVADLEGVRVLYIGPGTLGRARSLLEAASRRPILTVTDDRDGLADGGIINFVRVDRSVRIEVSLPAAARSGLKIDSGLLSVAARVER